MSVRLAKNTLLLTSASVAQKLIAFVYFLFLARIMMPEATGVFFLATSFITMFSVLTDAGMTPVIIREIAKSPERTVSLLTEALGIKLWLNLVSIFAVLFVSHALSYETSTTHIIWFAIPVMIIDSLHYLLYGVLRGHQQLKYEAVGMFAGQAVTSLFGAIVLWLHPSLSWLILALVFGSLTNLLISTIIIGKRFGWRALVPSWHVVSMKRLFLTSSPFALTALFTKISSSIDTILISKFLPVAAIGLYGVAFKFTYAFQFLPLAFSAALYPGLSSLVGKDVKATERLFLRAIWYILIIATPIVFGLWLVAPYAVLLAGEEYRGAAPVLQVLIFVLFPVFLDFPFGALFNACNRQKTRMMIVGVGTLLDIVLNVFLIPTLGLYGAAIAALSSFALMLTIDLLMVRVLIPGFSYRSFFRMLVSILIAGCLMAVIGFELLRMLDWKLVIVCAAVIYVSLLFLMRAFTKADVRMIGNLFQKGVV